MWERERESADAAAFFYHSVWTLQEPSPALGSACRPLAAGCGDHAGGTRATVRRSSVMFESCRSDVRGPDHTHAAHNKGRRSIPSSCAELEPACRMYGHMVVIHLLSRPRSVNFADCFADLGPKSTNF